MVVDIEVINKFGYIFQKGCGTYEAWHLWICKSVNFQARTSRFCMEKDLNNTNEIIMMILMIMKMMIMMMIMIRGFGKAEVWSDFCSCYFCTLP